MPTGSAWPGFQYFSMFLARIPFCAAFPGCDLENNNGRTGDGKCVVCDSYVRPCTLVRICDECNYGSYAGRCVICGGVGISDAYYCKECTVQEKDVSPQCHGICLLRYPVTLHRDGDMIFINAAASALCLRLIVHQPQACHFLADCRIVLRQSSSLY